MNWTRLTTLEGISSTCGEWKILRRRGDDIFNVFRGGKIIALGFKSQRLAEIFAERKEGAL